MKKNEDLAKLNPYDVVDETRSATIIKESITFSGEIANAVIDFGREKDSRGNGCRRKCNRDH